MQLLTCCKNFLLIDVHKSQLGFSSKIEMPKLGLARNLPSYAWLSSGNFSLNSSLIDTIKDLNFSFCLEFKFNYLVTCPKMMPHFFLGAKRFCLSRQKAEIFSIFMIQDFVKPQKISTHLNNFYLVQGMLLIEFKFSQ